MQEHVDAQPEMLQATVGVYPRWQQQQQQQQLAWMPTLKQHPHSSSVEARCTAEGAHLSAEAEQGSCVAAAIREVAREVGKEDPLLRLQAAALVGEAAALLHSIKDALVSLPVQKPVGGHRSTVLGSEHTQSMAASAGRVANALEFWHFRLTTLPVSVSLVSLGSREGAPWKPRPFGALSGVSATPLLQLPAATYELLLMNQEIRLALRFLATVNAWALEKIQPLHLRCMQVLQQAQQVAMQLALQAMAAKAGTLEEASAEAPAADTAGPCPDSCGRASLPLPISSSTKPYYSRVDWQLLLGSRGALAVPVLNKGWSTAGKVQHRQQEVLHLWPKPLALPLGHLLWSLRFIGKRHTAQELLLSRGVFLPTVSPHWRGELMGCTVSVPEGSTVEGGFLLKHAAKLHALLTAPRMPDFALR